MESVREKFTLRIERMSDGGFVVFDSSCVNQGYYQGPIYASTDISEALAYIRKQLTSECKK